MREDGGVSHRSGHPEGDKLCIWERNKTLSLKGFAGLCTLKIVTMRGDRC